MADSAGRSPGRARDECQEIAARVAEIHLQSAVDRSVAAEARAAATLDRLRAASVANALSAIADKLDEITTS